MRESPRSASRAGSPIHPYPCSVQSHRRPLLRQIRQKSERRSRTSVVPCLASETWASSPPLVSAYNPRMPPTYAACDSQKLIGLLSSESASKQPRSPWPNKRPLQPAPRYHVGTLHVYVLVSAPLHHDTGYILARPLPRKARAASPPATHLSLRKNQQREESQPEYAH